MTKKLEEMSLEELWQLFPVFLVDHSEKWKSLYEEERSTVCSLISGNRISRISHIGSTAIPKIRAKNIIDILVEVNNISDLEESCSALTANGWRCMSKTERRISLNKGYTENGFAEKVFHLHLRLAGDNDELYFRDYMTEHAEAAEEYEALKLSLIKKFEHDRDGYTEAKTEFIKKYTVIAKEEYKDRYLPD